jgi:signal transduction histidine kinase
VNGVSEDTLHGVLKAKRELLVACWSTKIRAAISAPLTNAELIDKIPAFVDEVIAALYPNAATLPTASAYASEHGAQRLRLHFDVGEVVREYGLLHECILDLARDVGLTISLPEQQVIMKWMNSGIADALAQYVKRRDQELERQASAHLGFIAHELRNPLSTARAAVHRLRGAGNAAGARAVDLIDRSLRRSADLIDNALAHATLKLGVDPKMEAIVLSDLLHDIELDASADAQARGVDLLVAASGRTVISADPRLLRSAVFNLVQNALKFSPTGATVTVSARNASDAVTIDVADTCGGLPPGKIEDLFRPTVQRNENRSGFGLGLSIARQAVEAHGGHIDVRDLPGTGCVFSVRLPQRHADGNLAPSPRIEG